MALSRFTADGRGRGFTSDGQLSPVTLDPKADTNLLMRELPTQETCEASDGQWITGEAKLIQERIRPSETITDYNQSWFRILNELENEVTTATNQLMQKSQKIFTEEVVEKDGGKTKTFRDQLLSISELDTIIKETKQIITELLTNIEAKRLILINLPIVTQEDLDEKEKRDSVHRTAGEASANQESILKASNS